MISNRFFIFSLFCLTSFTNVQFINSSDYLKLKKEYILKKREEVKDIFSPYKRTYFTLEDISLLAKQLNINSDDIILYFFEKKKKRICII